MMKHQHKFTSIEKGGHDSSCCGCCYCSQSTKRWTWVPIIYFFDGRSRSIHKECFFYLAGTLMEHFLEGMAPLNAIPSFTY